MNDKMSVCMSNKRPVRVDFQEVASEKYYKHVERLVGDAFGLDGFGAIIITNIPNFKQIRHKVLKNMYTLSQEPQEILNGLRQPNKESLYEVGWHTKKMNSAFGKSSNRFVSFFSRYPKETVQFPLDKKFEEENINIWPDTVKNFKDDLLQLNQNLMPPVLGLLKYIDGYLSKKIINYKKNKLVSSFSKNYSNSNRLIAYTPLEEFTLNEEDKYNWDNWHTDFGLLAAATHPIYLTKNGEIYNLKDSCLALKDRNGNEHELEFSEDEFLVTTSDAMFIESAGYIPATPHTVKIKKCLPKNIYRCQSVSFFEPHLDYIMDIPTNESYDKIIERDPTKYNHRAVEQFKNGCLYKEFIDELLEFLYK